MKTLCDLETCDTNVESKLCPGQHQKDCGQQGKGRDSAPLLHSHEIPPGVLHLPLVFATQERYESVVGHDCEWPFIVLLEQAGHSLEQYELGVFVHSRKVKQDRLLRSLSAQSILGFCDSMVCEH